MSTHGPDDSDGDWVKRYRQASDFDAAMPSAAAREAILAEGRRVAASRAADPTTHRFDTKQPAANQSRWKLAAVGTVGAALFAAVLMYPHLGAPPSPPVAEIASTTAPATAAAPALKKQAEARDSSLDAPVEEIVVTGARQIRMPDRLAARKLQSAPAAAAGRIDTSADAAPRESQEASNHPQAGAQVEHMATPAAAPPPALSTAKTAQATRANLTSDSLLSSVVSGDLARVSALLNEGANPEQVDSLGRTPLLLAVIAQREDMVELLLSHHADPNVSDHSGQTPLQRARLDAQLNIVHLLERAGAH